MTNVLQFTKDASGRDIVRAIGPTDTADLSAGRKFATVSDAEIEQILGRLPPKNPDGTLMFADGEIEALGATSAILEVLQGVRNPRQRRKVLAAALAKSKHKWGDKVAEKIERMVAEGIGVAVKQEAKKRLGPGFDFADHVALKLQELFGVIPDDLLVRFADLNLALNKLYGGHEHEVDREYIWTLIFEGAFASASFHEKTSRLIANIERVKKELAAGARFVGTPRALIDVWEMCKQPLRLERPESGSSLHKVVEAWTAKPREIVFGWPGGVAKIEGQPFQDTQVFVVEHDWARAFERADEFSGGEWRAPYDQSVFEFKVNGRRCIAAIFQDGKQPGHFDTYWPLVQTPHGWCLPWIFDLIDGRAVPVQSKATAQDDAGAVALIQNLADFLLAQVRAVCITLDAKVATTQIIRAPHRLNAKREKIGRLPLYDFHTVDLNRRSRPEPLPRSELDPEREITRKRLHWRRGHWRHYENHKVWLNWMLCGDPDLGFVDKTYRL